MWYRYCLLMVLACLGCTRAISSPATGSPATGSPATGSPLNTTAPVAQRETHWLQVVTGSKLQAVRGTNYLCDTTGKIWISVNGSELSLVPALSIDRLLGLSQKFSTELLLDASIVWAVGDAGGPRYALFHRYPSSQDDNCPGIGNVFIEREGDSWRFVGEPDSDRSEPLALSNGDFKKGLVYIDSINSCGHGGPPFDYTVRIQGAANHWPSPRRFSIKFMGGKLTVSEVEFSKFTITPQGDLIVLGTHRPGGEELDSSNTRYVLEVFRKGAKATKIIMVEPEEERLENEPTIVATSSSAFVLSSGNPGYLRSGSFNGGVWSWTDVVNQEEADWYEKVRIDLIDKPLLVGGEPFVLRDMFRHANVYWLVGEAGHRDVTFVEARVHLKTDPANVTASALPIVVPQGRPDSW